MKIKKAGKPEDRDDVSLRTHYITIEANGDQVVWIPDRKRPGKRLPLRLLRSYESIGEKFDTLQMEARKIHEGRGWEDDINEMLKLDFLRDRLALLSWVMGSDWDDSLDSDKWHFQQMEGKREREVEVTVSPEGEYEFVRTVPNPDSAQPPAHAHGGGRV